METLSTKPYLLRAIWEWAEDSGLSPQLMVNARFEGVVVPENHVSDGQIVLNVSSSAVEMQAMDNDKVAFSARFGGAKFEVYLPMNSIEAIFAKENAQGIYFESDVDSDAIELDDDTTSTSGNETQPPSGAKKTKAKKTDRSHLKVIK